MTVVKLDIAFWNYDRTRTLSEGKVRIPVDAKFHSGSNVAEIFRGMVAEHRFDASELGLTYFLRTFKAGESPFVAIPVFPVRAFRHSAIFVNANSGISKPEDLNGKTIGELALYSHDAGIVPKGMLMEEFGFKPETCRWLIGGLDWPFEPIRFVSSPSPANVKVADVPSGRDLGAMLDAGEIDALISADPPKMHAGTLAARAASLPGLRESGARLLQAHRNLPDHAHRRDTSRAFERTSWN